MSVAIFGTRPTSETPAEEMEAPCHRASSQSHSAVPAALPGSSTEMPFAPGLKLHCLLLFLAGERVELQGTGAINPGLVNKGTLKGPLHQLMQS